MTKGLLFQTTFLPEPLNIQISRRDLPIPCGCSRRKGVAICAAVGVKPQAQHTLYDLLELAPDVNISDIKHAYRQLARKYHPDVCPPHQAEESTRRFIELQQAYETLSDPRLRAIYDHAVAMGRGSAATGRTPWMSSSVEKQSSRWKSQWESQLSGLRYRSEWKARQADSWRGRVRQEASSGESSPSY